MVQFLKANAVLLALVVILYQQSELKRVERTLNYIYAAVQMNNNDIQATREEVWAVSDLSLPYTKRKPLPQNNGVYFWGGHGYCRAAAPCCHGGKVRLMSEITSGF